MLFDMGAPLGLRPAGAAAVMMCRIESGMIMGEPEYDDSMTPFECRMGWRASNGSFQRLETNWKSPLMLAVSQKSSRPRFTNLNELKYAHNFYIPRPQLSNYQRPMMIPNSSSRTGPRFNSSSSDTSVRAWRSRSQVNRWSRSSTQIA